MSNKNELSTGPAWWNASVGRREALMAAGVLGFGVAAGVALNSPEEAYATLIDDVDGEQYTTGIEWAMYSNGQKSTGVNNHNAGFLLKAWRFEDTTGFTFSYSTSAAGSSKSTKSSDFDLVYGTIDSFASNIETKTISGNSATAASSSPSIDDSFYASFLGNGTTYDSYRYQYAPRARKLCTQIDLSTLENPSKMQVQYCVATGASLNYNTSSGANPSFDSFTTVGADLSDYKYLEVWSFFEDLTATELGLVGADGILTSDGKSEVYPASKVAKILYDGTQYDPSFVTKQGLNGCWQKTWMTLYGVKSDGTYVTLVAKLQEAYGAFTKESSSSSHHSSRWWNNGYGGTWYDTSNKIAMGAVVQIKFAEKTEIAPIEFSVTYADGNAYNGEWTNEELHANFKWDYGIYASYPTLAGANPSNGANASTYEVATLCKKSGDSVIQWKPSTTTVAGIGNGKSIRLNNYSTSTGSGYFSIKSGNNQAIDSELCGAARFSTATSFTESAITSYFENSVSTSAPVRVEYKAPTIDSCSHSGTTLTVKATDPDADNGVQASGIASISYEATWSGGTTATGEQTYAATSSDGRSAATVEYSFTLAKSEEPSSIVVTVVDQAGNVTTGSLSDSGGTPGTSSDSETNGEGFNVQRY